MAISSIHIEAGNGGYFDHNSRERETANAIFDDEPNFCSCSKAEAFETFRSELKIRSDAYTERTGQKLQRNVVTHLSAIVNFNADHTPEDMQRVCDLLERKFDTKVIQFAMHRDEGKVNEDGTPDKNYHAHIEFMGLDSKGESVRRKLTKATLSNLQTEVADTLKMERGVNGTYTKEQYDLITQDLKKPEEYGSKKEYNKAFRERALELGIHKPKRTKRLDTYDYKFHQQEKEKAVKEAVLATQKELKAEMAKLREQLQQAGAGRAEYAALEQLTRELKEQIKAKDLTVDQLTEQIERHKAEGVDKDAKIASLEAKLTEAAKVPHEPINASLIVKLQDEVKLLQLTNKGLEIELEKTKSATVPEPAKAENAASRAVEGYLETLPKSTGVQIKTTDLEEVSFYSQAGEKAAKYSRGEEFAAELVKKHTNFVGKVDKDALIAELGQEFKQSSGIMYKGLSIVEDFKRGYDNAKRGFSDALKRTETALKDVFGKITGKSLSEVQNERREQERAQRAELVKQKEAEQPFELKRPSRGLSLGR